ILIILHGNNAFSKIYYNYLRNNHKINIPIIMTSGEDKSPDWINEDNKYDKFVYILPLQDKISIFLENWKTNKYSPNKIPFDSFHEPFYVDIYFRTMNILIEGLLNIKGIAEKNEPWWWLNDEERKKAKCIAITNRTELVRQHWDIIKSNPCEWFKDAVKDIREVFPEDNKLNELLKNIPEKKKIHCIEALFPDSIETDLVKLCKLILKCTHNSDESDFSMLLDEKLLKGAHDIYIQMQMNSEKIKLINIEEYIFNEFHNFNIYVSHTLCKNGLFLYLRANNADVVFKSLSEPSAWSVLKSEIQNLFDLAPKLYGINCPNVIVDDKLIIYKSIAAIEELRNSDNKSLKVLIDNAEIIRNILENITKKINKETFNLDINSVKDYLSNKSADNMILEIKDDLTEKITSLIETTEEGLVMSKENAENYWKQYPMIMLKIRECINAGIIQEKDDEFMAEIKRIMHAIIRCDLPQLKSFETKAHQR
ncbi:MAG: hypothetical protein HQK96_20855, partial [Nitrospirae bacterium]|nr:hypothetical protein [Nitrospirota bacterium]